MTSQGITKPQLLLAALIIIVVASMAVIADNTTTNASANLTVTSDAALQAPNGTVPTILTSSATSILNLSTPLQVLTATDQAGLPAGYIVNAQVFLNTSGYNCTITDDGKVYLTCDSIYDGNGDGKCTSGESCLQFGIVGSFVTRKERNSQDQFVDHDPTFVLARPAVTA